MRLVDADALLSELEKYNDPSAREKNEYLFGMQQRLETCIDVVEDAPTVDAVPVRHGRWIRVYSRPGVFKYLGWTCDQCGQRTGNEYAPQWYKFCPNCGALMDGKDGDNGQND